MVTPHGVFPFSSFSSFLFPFRSPKALPAASKALPGTFVILPAAFEALQAASEAFSATSEALSAASEALSAASEALSAASEALQGARGPPSYLRDPLCLRCPLGPFNCLRVPLQLNLRPPLTPSFPLLYRSLFPAWFPFSTCAIRFSQIVFVSTQLLNELS